MPDELVSRSGSDRQQSMRSKRRLGDRIEISRAITSEKDMTGQESFTEKPNASNSTVQLLSLVNWRTEIRFFIMLEVTRLVKTVGDFHLFGAMWLLHVLSKRAIPKGAYDAFLRYREASKLDLSVESRRAFLETTLEEPF
ncbi:hypothetical protein Tco_0438791 [Tanacetum coccineum]